MESGENPRTPAHMRGQLYPPFPEMVPSDPWQQWWPTLAASVSPGRHARYVLLLRTVMGVVMAILVLSDHIRQRILASLCPWTRRWHLSSVVARACESGKELRPDPASQPHLPPILLWDLLLPSRSCFVTVLFAPAVTLPEIPIPPPSTPGFLCILRSIA